MTIPRDRAYTWITWVSKLLVGENVCTWATWFKTHYHRYVPVESDFDSAGCNVKHTEALMELPGRLESEGHEMSVENQNSFRLDHGEPGSVLAGKPDLVKVHPDGPTTVYDVKTGRELDSHVVQVKLYMYLLPRARGTRWHGMTFDGCIVYGNGVQRQIPATAMDDEFRTVVRNLMRRVVSEAPARRVPSSQECRFCILSASDCLEPIESGVG